MKSILRYKSFWIGALLIDLGVNACMYAAVRQREAEWKRQQEAIWTEADKAVTDSADASTE